MKAYKGSFKKKNGDKREMVFSRIKDLPNGFVAARIVGAGSERSYPEGMELVWDLEADDFRIFNYKTADNDIQELDVDGSYYLKF
jgi:hypothetical protein|tara:strand:- start:507 stop:761 length:255 start_codon:yes stop_codon:yes gene_type:complete